MRRVLLALGALAAIGGVVALVVIAADDPEPELAPPAADSVVMEATVSPTRYGFGDRLVAQMELLVDSTRVDPASVVPAVFFRPFRRIGPIETERRDLGSTTVLRFDYHIQCVDRACVPRAAERAIELPIGLVRYSPREGDVVTLPVEWPSVEVSSSLSSGIRRDISLRPPATLTADAATDTVPPLHFRGGSGLLGWLLVGTAAAIVLALAGWVVWRARPRRTAIRSAEPEQPPLEVALERVDHALVDGGEDERRAALDVLARRLDEAGQGGLARDARRLAWSEPGPQPDMVAALADAARERTGQAA
jgi:hypothetical protein